MAKVALALTKVTCADGTTDYNVGLNPNTNADDKVQSFVDAFKSVGNTASSTCHGLPLKLILAVRECLLVAFLLLDGKNLILVFFQHRLRF